MSHWKLEISFDAPHDVAMQTAAWMEAEAIQFLAERNQPAVVSTAIQSPEVAEVPAALAPEPIRPVVQFVPGETVRCRNNEAEEESLSLLRAYEVLAIDEREGEVQVRDDLNTRTFFNAARFESALSA